MEFIETVLPGKALDIGCGTGTNAITLANHGWEVTGVDFAAKAIRTARRKTAAADLKIDFYAADVTDLGFLTGRFDYILDIGCLFTLNTKDRIIYAETLARLTRPGGCYMLYAWQPQLLKGKPRGISPEDLEMLLAGFFMKDRVELGEYEGRPCGWYRYRRQ